MTDEDDIARAERASALMNDPLVVETFAALEAEYTRRWRTSPAPEEREEMWLLLQNLDTFRGLFGAYIRKGQVAVAVRERKAETRRQMADRQDHER